MSDIVTGIRQAIQDLVAPDLKANGAKLDALQKQMEMVQVGLQKQMEAQQATLQKQMEAQQVGLQKQMEAQQATLQKQMELQQASLQKQMEMLQKHIDVQHESVVKSTALQYEAVIKTMDGIRAEMRSGFSMIDTNQQLEILRHIGPLSERIAALEARHKIA